MRVIKSGIMRRIGHVGSSGSSGSIVSDYGLDDRGSIPDRDKEFLF
jgi:hypothetical protein